MNPILEQLTKAVARSGLNLIAATPAARYDNVVSSQYRVSSIAPEMQSIIVIGNGGGAFWKAFSQHADRHSGWTAREHPLDDFTRFVIEREVVPILATSQSAHRLVYPFIGDGPTLSFMAAGKAAGLSGPSLLGVMVHPMYGPWIAFRAAILIDQILDAPGPALGFDPCPTCESRSCIAACPAQTVSVEKGWDIPKCVTHRVEVEADCATRCHARVGCVLGPEHRYPDEELAYHQMRSLRAMRPWYETHLKPKNRQ